MKKPDYADGVAVIPAAPRQTRERLPRLGAALIATPMKNLKHAKSLLILGGLVLSLAPQPTFASSEYISRVPNGDVNRCATCHDRSGPPELNPFGEAFFGGGEKWGPDLARSDADKDGFSNGAELGDPDGNWSAGDPPPLVAATVSLPGDPTSRPVPISRLGALVVAVTTWVGHFHPVFVHLPIGGLLLVGFLEILSLFSRLNGVARNRRLILTATFAGAVIAVVCGWELSQSGRYQTGLLRLHKWTGIALAAGCLVTLALTYGRRQKAYQVSLWGTIGLLCVASHYGGSLTHGEDFLTLKLPAGKAVPAQSAAQVIEGTHAMASSP